MVVMMSSIVSPSNHLDVQWLFKCHTKDDILVQVVPGDACHFKACAESWKSGKTVIWGTELCVRFCLQHNLGMITRKIKVYILWTIHTRVALLPIQVGGNVA